MHRIRTALYVITALMATGLANLSTAMEEPPRRRPPVAVKPAPALTSFPDKKLAAAAARWKIENALKRIRRAGAAGRHDLFWELLTLLEKDDKARADADLVAVMDWLLFTARLWKHADLGPAASRKIPKLVPALGERLMVVRLEEWISRAAVRYPGGEPWNWPEFSGNGRRNLGKAARKLLTAGPRHNPLTRVWIAAALVVAGEKDGGKELAAARKLLKERLPSRDARVTYLLGSSLATGGARECLALLLDAAESHQADNRVPRGRVVPGKSGRPVPEEKLDEAAEKVPAKRARPFVRSYWPPALTRFYALVGWILPADRGNASGTIAAARKWLGANLAKLSWDAKVGRFAGGAPQPGLEALHRAAAALRKKSGYDVISGLRVGTHSAVNALLQLVDFGQKDAAAARTAEFKAVAKELIRLAGSSLSSYRTKLMPKLAAVAPELAVEVCVSSISPVLEQMATTGSYYDLASLRGVKPEMLAAACARLRPEFKKRYLEAGKTNSAEKKMYTGLTYLYVGGKLSQGEVHRLVSDGIKANARYQRQLIQAADYVARTGSVAGLRLMLAVARVEIAAGGSRVPRYNPALSNFNRLVGWAGHHMKISGASLEDVRKAEKWIDEHEKSLKWDAGKQRFTGALHPDLAKRERLCRAIEKKWGLKLGKDMADPRNGHARAAGALLKLVRGKPAAAKDANVVELVEELVGRVFSPHIGAGRLVTELPKVNRELGRRALGAWVRQHLKAGAASPGALSMLVHPQGRKDLNPAELREACKPLVAEFQAEFARSVEKKESAGDQLHKAWACAFVGGKVDEALVRKLMKADSERRGGHSESIWGAILVVAGRRLGLKVLLWHAALKSKHTGAYALGQFEYLSGRSNKRSSRYYRLSAEKIKAAAGQQLAWLKANEDKLAWNPKDGRFRLTGKAAEPANPKGPEIF